MEILVDRYSCDRQRTLGRLYIDHCSQCFTLEDPVREIGPNGEGKIKGETAIPAGRYRVTMRYSHRFDRLMPHIEDVPHFSEIMFHTGNFTSDTEGCIIVGRRPMQSGVLESRLAFEALCARISSVLASNGEVWVTVQ